MYTQQLLVEQKLEKADLSVMLSHNEMHRGSYVELLFCYFIVLFCCIVDS